ncbi:MAG: transcription-repair coupling factor [Calditerrivibrio sp.]|nr:transcription-repair coupling factor [Calditerrivibrio sp.]
MVQGANPLSLEYKEFSGLWGSARSYYLTKFIDRNKKYLVLVDDYLYERIFNELDFFLKDHLLPFPSYQHEPFEKTRIMPKIVGKRLETLIKLLNGSSGVVLCTIYGLVKKVIPSEILSSSLITIRKGDIFNRDELIYYLDYLGFIQVEIVTGEGEFSYRGDVVDFYPVNYDSPIRVEFFDNDIEAIYEYNIDTQKRTMELKEFVIIPANEGIYDLDDFKKALKSDTLKEKANLYGKFAGHHWYAPCVYKQMSTLFDYLKDWEIVYIGEHLEHEIDKFYLRLMDACGEYSVDDFILNGNFLTKQDLKKVLDKEIVWLTEVYTEGSTKLIDFKSTTFVVQGLKNSYQSLARLADFFKEYRGKGIKTVVAVESERFQTIIKDFFRDYEIDINVCKSYEELNVAKLNMYPFSITGGFINEKDHLAFFRDEDIFGFVRKGRKKGRKDVFRTNISDLEIGDYVVHVDYGIGIFKGLEHKKIGGIEGDYLTIEYEGGEILFVSLENIGQIQKYIGVGDSAPKINSLQSTKWKKLKEQAQKSAKKIAIDLLKLYAERKAKKGFAFKDDGAFLKIIEDSFEYDETEDQLNAIKDVLYDMEKEQPMDRLVCGDVGFGKTEVAVRAACKCCSSGKQVAILAPTTILVKQHFETFKKRFKYLPFRIEYISRFRSRKEISEVLKDLSRGAVDIIIGTHRLLSNDVIFKDLGLLVIDEEQRFGVAHKEKIKNLKSNIDVLAMSATPIPRTLQFSLSGIRDISIIETPPEDRLPVITNIISSEDEVKNALLHELKRGGQAYYLFNDLKKIEEVAYRIKGMLPEARVEIAHGQMDPAKVEKVLDRFYEGDLDVLVCSTIIENGIDIPNVNTIIIDGAERFGLSQLYQLKGRVGRSDRRGYCYLFVRNFNLLSILAKKRIKIIQQMSDLGSGFKIASYDLQLRGAGEMLGAEQSGHISSIGYELYIQMINDAIQELKGEHVKHVDTEIQASIPYFIPADYIVEPTERMRWYNRLSDLDRQMYLSLEEELSSNYGDIPEPVRNLLNIMYIKYLSSRISIKKVVISGKQIKFFFDDSTNIDPHTILKVLAESSIKGNFGLDNTLVLSGDNICTVCIDFLEKLQS